MNYHTMRVRNWPSTVKESSRPSAQFKNVIEITSCTGEWLCGSVVRVVTSDTRGPRFKSSHRQKFIDIEHLFTVNCVLKR